MEALLGFQVGVWDYATFLVLEPFLVAAGLAVAVFVLGLPGRIAIARKHPEADAVYLMGWIGFLAVAPSIQALAWAFKPTTVINVRYLPAETRRDTDEMIAKLTGEASACLPGPARHIVMIAALLVLTVACSVFWLVFFKFELIRLTPGWGIVFALFRRPPDACLPDRYAVRNSVFHQCNGGSAYHSADPAFAGANACDGCSR